MDSNSFYLFLHSHHGVIFSGIFKRPNRSVNAPRVLLSFHIDYCFDDFLNRCSP